ncbi:alpha/beta fold hydrolase [Alteromonas sp. MTD1]|uniref:alpha/beta fold hydrolase n=1 Tax=Alteromonas sp. MTD1 TaxID=3057962 RepID=UPI0036F26DC8
MFDIEIHKATAPIARLVLAHGAGAGKEHDFMQTMATLLNDQHIDVVLFNFPYMQTINETGKRRPPDKADKLLAHFESVIDHVVSKSDALPTFVGGKSMGGRMASMLVDSNEHVNGCVALGYPFHPPGKPEKTRTAHLESMKKPMLIVQGERDTFGTQTEVREYSLASTIQCEFLADGDHSLKPRKASGLTHQQHLESAAKLIHAFFVQNT